MFRNIFIFGFSEGLTKVTPFITSLLFAYYLPVEEFGYLALYIVTYELVFILAANNISAVFRVQFFKRSSNIIDYIVLSSIINTLKLVAVLFLLLLAICFILNLPSLIISLPLLAFFRTLSIIALARAQCMQEPLVYLKVNLIYFIFYVFSIWFFIDYGVTGWFYALIVATIFQALYAINKINILKINVQIVRSSRRFHYLFFLLGLLFCLRLLVGGGSQVQIGLLLSLCTA